MMEVDKDENDSNVFEFVAVESLDEVYSKNDEIDYDSDGVIYDEEESGLLEEPDFEFITNQKGGKKLYAFGFGFLKYKSRGGRANWRCEFHEKGCSASATTIELADGAHRVCSVGSEHNHLVDLDRKEKFQGRYQMKLQALQNAETLPISISQNALDKNRHLGEYFGTSHQLRQVIRYSRRKKLNRSPLVDPNDVSFEIHDHSAHVSGNEADENQQQPFDEGAGRSAGYSKNDEIDYDSEGVIYDEEESGLLEEPDFEFITNQKGGKKLYAFGFGFLKYRSRGRRVNWRCEFHEKGCSATATTIELSDGSHRVCCVGSEHNHLVDLDRKEKFQGRYQMKLQALQNAETLPISISQNALDKNRHLGEYFGTSHQLRQVIRYSRRKKLNRSPLVDPNDVSFEIHDHSAHVSGNEADENQQQPFDEGAGRSAGYSKNDKIDYDSDGVKYDEEESGLLEEPDFEFITNQKGGKKLYAFGFGFLKYRSRRGRANWRCEFYEKGCSASATTIELADGAHRVCCVGSEHNHLVDLDRKEKFQGRYQMKLQALQNAETLPISISQNALDKNRHLGEYFGTSHQLRKVIRYSRRKKLNRYPLVDPNDVSFEIHDHFAHVSGNEADENQQQPFDDGEGRSAGYVCNLCSRVFNTTRGFGIHKAAHKRKSKK